MVPLISSGTLFTLDIGRIIPPTLKSEIATYVLLTIFIYFSIPFRTWRIFSDENREYVTALSFASQDPSRIWLAYSLRDDEPDTTYGELHLHDVKTHFSYTNSANAVTWQNKEVVQVDCIIIGYSSKYALNIVLIIRTLSDPLKANSFCIHNFY